MNCLTTAGTIILFALIGISFGAGFYIGSFRTKRQAKLVGTVKNWKIEVTDKIKDLKKRL